ncbi:endospore germination permease [Paenibacillus sp. NEAU-GSW1]|uniref:GerAB/ArcD/ProY family transporter n=1 Tax=Paenibacillus sp. NEAU-GSW1 TaxID=2682486 RepID=UPI0012E230D6|nr:endospore germination permease [Paenibacillus sp. NEAU-GSW1]MUT67479.1 endospore germination permease [Paenibacillus sp. NEAU-GSW1]
MPPLEQGKISAAQLACMIYLALLATAILSGPPILYRHAGVDFWMGPIIASVTGFGACAMMVYLHRLYPGQSLVQYADHLIGKAAGKTVSFVFLLVLVFQNGQQARQFSEMMSLAFLERTPPLVLSGTLLALSTITVRYGVEVIGRCAQLLMPILITLTSLLIAPLISDMEPENLLPFLENGIVPVMKSTIMMQVWFPMYAYMTFFLPFVHNINQARKWGFLSVLWSVLTFTGTMLVILFVLDGAVSLFRFPYLIISRYLAIFGFFSRLDIIIMVFWIVDVFVRFIVLHYAAAIGLAQWFGASSYRHLAAPLAVLILVFSVWSYPSSVDFYSIPMHVSTLYFCANIILPAFLFIVSLLRGSPAAASDAE